MCEDGPESVVCESTKMDIFCHLKVISAHSCKLTSLKWQKEFRGGNEGIPEMKARSGVCVCSQM